MSNKLMADVITWIPIGLSGISLAVSAYTLWRSHLSKAHIHVAPTGRIEFSGDPGSPGAFRPALGMSFLATNSGARVGYLTDVALSVARKGLETPTEVFRSMYELLDDRLNLDPGIPPPPQWRAFRAFAVSPHETVLKRAFLVLFSDDSTFAFLPGEYEITLHTRAGERWQDHRPERFSLTAADIAAMRPEILPLSGGGRFMKLSVHSKPTDATCRVLEELTNRVRRRQFRPTE